MVCIYCQSETRVINSRLQKRVNNIWRRRKCESCKAVFTSVESPAFDKQLTVQQSPSHVQPFSRDQLFLSVYDSLKHRKTALNDASALTDTIVGHLLPRIQNAALESITIAEEANKILKRFDKVASVHYRAFHTR
jgi:transcriptional regulator NrdR family protein